MPHISVHFLKRSRFFFYTFSRCMPRTRIKTINKLKKIGTGRNGQAGGGGEMRENDKERLVKFFSKR